MPLPNTTIEEIVSGQTKRFALTQNYGGIFEAACALRNAAKSIPSNDNGTSLEDLGFQETVPQFVVHDLAPHHFAPNTNGEDFYTFPARPLESGETLKSTFIYALRGAGCVAVAGAMAAQAYILGGAATQSLPVACIFTSASALGLVGLYAACHNLKAAYNYATVNTLGVGIRVNKYNEEFGSKPDSDKNLVNFLDNNLQPVLYKA